MQTISHEFGARQLTAREVLSIRDGLGRAVTCCAGMLWITQEGDRRDILLGPGQRFVIDRQGLALISPALEASAALVRVT